MARTYTPVGWQDGTVLQPAKVNVQGTEYNVEPQVVSGQTPVNATNLRKMDNEIKRIVEEDIPSVYDVNLIAVTDVAPTECSVGDKYYNTDDNKIYEAIDTNTWDTSGEYPIEGISYVVFETQTSYAYNGTTLVSVGGGSGSSNIIIIGDETEATEDTKLIIEEDDMNLDLQGSDFLNEYSESTEKGYSCDYLDNNQANAKILWENPNPTSSFGTQDITLNSDDYDMLLWLFSTNNANSQYISVITIKGKGLYVSWVYNNGFVAREINYVNSTTYSVGDSKTNGTTLNINTIPQIVIGYKTGLFS